MMQDLGIHLDDENHPNFQDLSLEEREIRRTLWVSGIMQSEEAKATATDEDNQTVDRVFMGYDYESGLGSGSNMERAWPCTSRVPS